MNRFSFESTLNSYVISVVLILLISTFYLSLYGVTQPDHFKFLLPWLRTILDSKGLSAFETGFSNYTGGYITILALFSFLKPLLSELAIIKLTAVFGTALCAAGIGYCLRATGWCLLSAVNGALLFSVLPTIMLNGIAWGQADGYYGAFILYAMAAILSNRFSLAVLMFALAVSIKLQAILFAPFLVGVLIKKPKTLVLLTLIFFPIYFLVNTIYLIADRTIEDVLLIYVDQAQTFSRFSMNAGNFWMYVDVFASKAFVSENYFTIIVSAVLLTSIVGLWLVWIISNNSKDRTNLIALAAITTLLIPFLLPKMHERFFFMAEALLFLLCLIDRKYLPAVITAQLSGICMYSIYHDTLLIRQIIGWPWVMFVGVTLMMITIVFMLRLVFRR